MAHPRQLASRIIFYYTRAFTRARDVRTNTRALTRTRRKLDARVEAGRLQTQHIRACACPVPVHAPGYTRCTHPGQRRLAAAMRSSRVSLPGSATPPPTEALGSTGPGSCRASTNARSESACGAVLCLDRGRSVCACTYSPSRLLCRALCQTRRRERAILQIRKSLNWSPGALPAPPPASRSCSRVLPAASR